MTAGAPAAFTVASPVLEAAGASLFELGDEDGAGSAMKAVSQLLATAEARTFGMKQEMSQKIFLR